MFSILKVFVVCLCAHFVFGRPSKHNVEKRWAYIENSDRKSKFNSINLFKINSFVQIISLLLDIPFMYTSYFMLILFYVMTNSLKLGFYLCQLFTVRFTRVYWYCNEQQVTFTNKLSFLTRFLNSQRCFRPNPYNLILLITFA